ncbi:glutathione S-transferase family protein [Woodsholea maritima]|uniref:glutathione S-transferase family protein n=1 Tax=Woodsholea maritima TaxID=240237 RepID=UPI00036096C9|nr:glutathione S-transferase family protein [Woodsholea maritima]
MIFYDYLQAPSARRTRMALIEKRIEIETRYIDLGAGEQFSEAFKQINPRCTLPALMTDEGVVLSDNKAIAQYLESVFPDPPLLGTDRLEQALVWEWVGRIELDGLGACRDMLRNKLPVFHERALPGPERHAQIPALVDRGEDQAEFLLLDLNMRLSHSPWLAGEHFSIADIAGFVFVEFADRLHIPIHEGLEALKEWRTVIAARPSAQA